MLECKKAGIETTPIGDNYSILDNAMLKEF